MREDQSDNEWDEMDSASNLSGPVKTKRKKKAASPDTKHKCSQCDKPFRRSESKWMPFCSNRCQQIDLGNWLTESYGLPIEGHEDREFGTEEID